LCEDFDADADANFVFEILSQEQAVQVAPGWPWWAKTQAGTAGERTSSASGKGRDLFSSICSMQPCRVSFGVLELISMDHPHLSSFSCVRCIDSLGFHHLT